MRATWPKRECAASRAAATASTAIAATASTGTPASTDPTNIGTPVRTPSATTATRARRLAARPTRAAGTTPTASASPSGGSARTTTAAGSAYVAPSTAGDQSQASPGAWARPTRGVSLTGNDERPADSGPFGGWARRVSNLRPLACEASALPLSYAPGMLPLPGISPLPGPDPGGLTIRQNPPEPAYFLPSDGSNGRNRTSWPTGYRRAMRRLRADARPVWRR